MCGFLLSHSSQFGINAIQLQTSFSGNCVYKYCFLIFFHSFMWFLSISKYNAFLEVLMGKYLSNGIGLYSNVDDKISVCP